MYTQMKSRKTLFRKAISFLIVLCMMISAIVTLTAVTASAAAPASYTTITADSTASVSITSSGSAKYFKFVPTASGTYKFYSTNYSGDPYGALLDASGSTLISDDDDGTYNFSFTYACTANTTYYVKAYMFGSNTGSYTLNVETVSIDCEHSYVLQSTTVADCENSGVETYVCSLCGDSYTNTVATALGHNFENGACTRCGSIDYANATCISITTAGGTNYPLFNSGRTTSSGYDADCNSTNPSPNTYDNSGYDLYGSISDLSRFRLGLSFTMNIDVSEQSSLSIYAWDVDESVAACGHGYEYDYIYLIDETTGVSTNLNAHLSGQDDTWNTSIITISPDYFTTGHTYHFELQMTCTGSNNCSYYAITVRTVNLIVNGASEPPVNPTTGIENADLDASISSSGLVSVDLTANAYAAENYTLEYKAVCSADSAQYGGKEYSVTIPTTSTEFDTTFQLESGAPRGTYEITVFIKDSAGTVIATRTATASYGYSAVSYNSNGGSQNLPTDGTTYSSGDTVTVKFDYVPSMYGYTFLGWSTDRNATEPMYTENGTKTFTIGASDVTLYAVWALDVCEHEWSETTHTDATCTTDGLIVNTCSLCGDTQESEIPALGHNYVSGVCSRCGAAEPSADIWDGSIDTSWYNSTDTEFTIYTAEQLAGLAQLVNNGNTFSGKTIYLGNNIDLDNREWTPIGSSSGWGSVGICFSGCFWGNGYQIQGLAMSSTVNYNAALFGSIYNANISMLSLTGISIQFSNIETSSILVAGLAAQAVNSTIERCSVEGSLMIVGDEYKAVGLLVGYGDTVEIKNSYAVGTVSVTDASGNAYVGGLVGAFENGEDTIENCYFDGRVSAITSETAYASGILGVNNSSVTIKNSFAVGEIATSDYDDPMYNTWSGDTATVTNCYFNMPITSSNATSVDVLSFKSQSWIETNLGWDFDTIWEFRGGNDYPVLQGFDDPTPPTPHTHNFEETSRTDPTCTVDGRINYACSCGETKVGVIPAIRHNIETTIETEATCTSDGLIVDRCVNDGCDYEKRTVIHGEHNYSVTDRQEAACETPGYIEYTCSNCGDKNYEYFEGRHNYVESSRTEAQVDVEGRITYTCTGCGDSYSVVIPALSPVLKNSAVLLIQNSLPWAEDVNTELLETLKDRGVVSYYNIINTSAIATTDLKQYGVIFIANDQTTSMYNGLAANAEALENYVRAGGNLIYGACDEGWGGCGSLTHALLGGVTTSNYYSVHNYIVNGLHPIVTGVYTDNRSLADELLKGNYCSHTYFIKESLPEGTDVILRDANGNPTLIEYSLGNGTVIASGLTWEYFYVRNHYNMITNYSKYAYDDLVTYMVYMSNTCEHDYEMVETVEPTCEENGYTMYVCTLCSHEYKGDIVNALGHTPGDWIIDVAATCIPGSQHKECIVCEALLETEAINPTSDHVVSDWIIDITPTATQTGSRHKECSVCQTVLETEVMPILAKLVIEKVEAEAGKTVRVTIDIQNNPGIIGALLTIEYDSALTLIGAEAGNAWNSLYFTAPNTFSNPCNFVWDGVSGADHSNGSIIVLTFVSPLGVDVGVIYNISASYTYGNMINENLEAVDLEIENGSITIVNPVGDVNDDGVVDIADVIVLRRYLAGGYEVVIDEFAADMDNDGYVTVADVVLLRRFLIG